MLKRPIPKIEVPSISSYTVNSKDEALVALSKAGFLVDSYYYLRGIAGAYKDCYVRESLVSMLKKAEGFLPDGLRLKVYDGYRPICVQQRLWNYHKGILKLENPDMDDEELDFKTSFYISKPSYDEERPSLHNTGGAVDVILVTDTGHALNMGTLYGDFTNRAWTNHFEDFDECAEVRDNRRILYNAMIEAGFTNLPSEWWHYDYGNKFWAYFTDNTPFYQGIIDVDLPDRFPLL